MPGSMLKVPQVPRFSPITLPGEKYATLTEPSMFVANRRRLPCLSCNSIPEKPRVCPEMQDVGWYGAPLSFKSLSTWAAQLTITKLDRRMTCVPMRRCPGEQQQLFAYSPWPRHCIRRATNPLHGLPRSPVHQTNPRRYPLLCRHLQPALVPGVRGQRGYRWTGTALRRSRSE